MSKQKSYHDNLAKNIKLSGAAATFFAEYKTQKIKQWVAHLIEQPISILDFGCGDGLMTSFIKHTFINATITGIDTSAEHIEFAQQAYDDITFSVSDFPIKFAPQTFDVIIASETFHHIPFEQHDQYLHEIKRILKPDGIFIMLELNPYHLPTRYRFQRDPLEKQSRMLTSKYSTTLLKKQFSSLDLLFCNFFSRPLGLIEKIDTYFSWLPLGALYAYIAKK